MKFTTTCLKGVYVIELDKRADERGSLARTWDREAFRQHGIEVDLLEGYVSRSACRGTLRGLHYQVHPNAEAKLVRCSQGAYYEVVLDLRESSETFGSWLGLTFHASDDKMLYVPPLCAHAVLTLEDETELINFSSAPYSPECERGVRFDDAKFNIRWPIEVTTISAKDSAWEDYDDRCR